MISAIAVAQLIVIISTIKCKAEYCGENKIPFGLEVYPNAQPLLHCSRPGCFAHRFATCCASVTRNSVHDFVCVHSSHLQDCDDRALRKSCESDDSWVGGFEKGYGDHQPLYVQCCTFEGLAKHSSPLYRTTIKPGQYFEGEEQVDEDTDEVVSFDVITNFKMIRHPNSSFVYELTVRRLRCMELPPVGSIKRPRRWP